MNCELSYKIRIKKGFNIDKKQVEFDHVVASLGYHDIKINLYKDIFVKVKVKLEK